MRVQMVDFLLNLRMRFPTFRNPSDEEFYSQVDIWSEDLLRYNVNPLELNDIYQKAIEIRLRNESKNNFPVNIYEMLTANQEISRNRQELLRKQKIEENLGRCQQCIWARQANTECRIHGSVYNLPE